MMAIKISGTEVIDDSRNITTSIGTVDGRDVATDGTKLDGIETGANVTDTANVTAAGALMDSELASVTAVKATTGTFLTADQSKLDGIEAGAKADQVGLVKGTYIAASADLDTYTTDGYFHQNSNASAQSGTNYPVALAGMLSVQADGNMVYQKYQTYNGGGAYQRTKYNASWFPWDKILDTGNAFIFTSADNTKLDGIASGATNTAAPAISSNGSTPSLVSGITAAEVRSLIGLGTAATTASTAYATAAQGTTADDALPKAGGTMTGDLVVKGVRETNFAPTGTTPAIDPGNGTIQTWTLSGASTPTFAAGWSANESITLMIADGSAYAITWPTMQWAGGSAPTLPTTGYAVVTLWKEGSTYYGVSAGDMS